MLNIIKFIILISVFLSSTSFSFANGSDSGVKAHLLKVADNRASGAYVRKRFISLQKVPFKQTDAKKKLLIIGDSHAQDFVNMIVENGYLSAYQIRTRYVYTRCQITLFSSSLHFVAEKDRNFCRYANNLRQAKKQISEADVIIFAANWREWAAKNLPQTIANLKLRTDQKLIVIGRKNFGKIAIRNYLRMSDNELLSLKNKVDSRQLRVNQLMQNNLGSQIFVDQHRLICGTTTRCPLFTADLKLISFDGGHLTKEGATYVGKILFRHSALSQL